MLVKVPPGDKLQLHSSLPTDPLPGMHWYHPHHHKSSTIQAYTANGLIIVEGTASVTISDRAGCTGGRCESVKGPNSSLSAHDCPRLWCV